jgi:hypothetical protein
MQNQQAAILFGGLLNTLAVFAAPAPRGAQILPPSLQVLAGKPRFLPGSHGSCREATGLAGKPRRAPRQEPRWPGPGHHPGCPNRARTPHSALPLLPLGNRPVARPAAAPRPAAARATSQCATSAHPTWVTGSFPGSRASPHS